MLWLKFMLSVRLSRFGCTQELGEHKSSVRVVSLMSIMWESLPARQPYISTLMVIFTFHVWGLNRTILAVKVWTSCLTTVLESVLPERVYKKMERLINVVVTADIFWNAINSSRNKYHGLQQKSCTHYSTDYFSSFPWTLHFPYIVYRLYGVVYFRTVLFLYTVLHLLYLL